MKMQKVFEMTDEELNEIECRIQAASSGPWFSYVVGRDAWAVSTCIELGTCNELGLCYEIELIGGTIADQDFIANARQDVPRLLREVRTLRARLQALGAARQDSEQSRCAVEPSAASVERPTLLHSAPL